jgi:rod shape-determining protein MreD
MWMEFVLPENYIEQEILSPASGWFVVLSLIAALLLNLFPLAGILLQLRPDFVALLLLYWCIHQPSYVGLSVAFGMGLLMDVGNTGTLGQYSLAYCVIVYLALVFHRRLRIFNPFQQAPQIGIFLFVMQFIILLTGLLSGFNFPGWYFFLNCITGMLIWPFVALFLRFAHKPKSDPDIL